MHIYVQLGRIVLSWQTLEQTVRELEDLAARGQRLVRLHVRAQHVHGISDERHTLKGDKQLSILDSVTYTCLIE